VIRTFRTMTIAAAAEAAMMLGGCAATVDTSTPTNFPAAAFKVPLESSKRLVLNLQLDGRHPKDSGWQSFRKEWVDIFEEQAKAKGLQFAVQDGDAKPTGESGVLLSVHIDDYKHVTVGQRLMLGIMTGNAYINAKASFRDLSSGTAYGERHYNTSSSAGQGIFAPVTPKQLYAISEDVLGQMNGR
jgi:hypothetical protein